MDIYQIIVTVLIIISGSILFTILLKKRIEMGHFLFKGKKYNFNNYYYVFPRDWDFDDEEAYRKIHPKDPW